MRIRIMSPILIILSCLSVLTAQQPTPPAPPLIKENATVKVSDQIGSLDKLEPLRAARIVPSHGDMGDGTLLETNRAYLKELQARVAVLKREGKTQAETTDLITSEFRSRYPGWTGNPGGAVRSAFMEAN